jgi:hypothetical protein
MESKAMKKRIEKIRYFLFFGYLAPESMKFLFLPKKFCKNGLIIIKLIKLKTLIEECV